MKVINEGDRSDGSVACAKMTMLALPGVPPVEIQLAIRAESLDP